MEKKDQGENLYPMELDLGIGEGFEETLGITKERMNEVKKEIFDAVLEEHKKTKILHRISKLAKNKNELAFFIWIAGSWHQKQMQVLENPLELLRMLSDLSEKEKGEDHVS